MIYLFFSSESYLYEQMGHFLWEKYGQKLPSTGVSNPMMMI
jgi:hypothetical protein